MGASRQGATELGDRGEPHVSVHPALLRALGRVAFRTSPLRERRHQVPGLSRFLLERVAMREGESSVALDDGALAMLWRQDHADHVAGLEALLHAAFLRRTSDAIDAQTIAAALDDVGVTPRRRCPSRAPSSLDLASAVWATRTSSGRINKTRAALYLGWDPNTVGGHLKTAGIHGLDDAQRLLLRPVGSPGATGRPDD